jgi:hypothetical protein
MSLPSGGNNSMCEPIQRSELCVELQVHRTVPQNLN